MTLAPYTATPAPPVVVPGPADAARIKPEERVPELQQRDDSQVTIPEGAPQTEAPPEAKGIVFTLHEVDIEGATVLAPNELDDIYKPFLGREVTLDIAWVIAGQISDRYHTRGYFLSRAYVPAQSIKEGKLIIKVIEGYIGSVEVKNSNYIINAYIDDIETKQPVKAAEVESFLLKLNDLPGLSFRAVLSAADSREEVNKGAVKLTLVPTETPDIGLINFDNYGSRFLGPNESSITYKANWIPLETTTISALSSLPTHELKYGTLNQSIVILPDLTLSLNGSYTQAYPGYNLEKFDIDSTSKIIGLNLNYQYIRQRDKNLNFRLAIDGTNTDSEILNTVLTRDRVRSVRLGVNFDFSDKWNGANNGSLTISHGLDILGSSKEGDLNLSREDAVPDYTKAEMSISRLQGLSDNWLLSLSASGQISSDPLFSSEEYGYGGQAFGRAYDSSEITGEDGLSGSAELRFTDLSPWESVNLAPYVFYDIGQIWDQGSDTTKASTQSGSSAGLGMRFSTDFHFAGNIGFAVPLTLPVATPVYGYGNHHNPRILLQISQQF